MKALAIFLFSLLFLLVFTIPTLAYYDIDTNGDSYVNEWNHATNYGTQTILACDHEWSGYDSYSFVSFNLSSIPYSETIIGASVMTTVTSGSVDGKGVNITIANTTYFNENNITWDNKPSANVTQSFNNVTETSGTVYNFSVANAVNHSFINNQTIYFILSSPASAENNTRRNFYSKEAGHDIPYLRVYTASGSGCNASDGYITGSACLNGTTFYTNDGCNYNLTTCASGSYCVQLTPQMNVTTDLLEDFTDCMATTIYGWKAKCINFCFGSTVVWSSCPTGECQQCADQNLGFNVNGQYGYYAKTYFTNQESVSVPSWTVACQYSNGTVAGYYNETGQSTTINEILTRAGNTITESQTNNTQTITQDMTSYDYLLTNPANWVAMGVGGIFSISNLSTAQQISSILFSFVISIALVLGIAIVGKGKMSSNNMITGFIVTAFGGLVMFTLMGWFPAWLMIVLIVIGSYIMAKTMGMGGGD